MSSPRQEVELLLRERVCRVCVSRLADGSCGFRGTWVCPVFGRLTELMTIVRLINDDAVHPYLDAVRQVICARCSMGNAEHCQRRDHLECALELYPSLIVETIEESLRIPQARPAG